MSDSSQHFRSIFHDFLFPSISFSDSRNCTDACMPLRADHALICSIWPFFHLFQQGGRFSESDFSEIGRQTTLRNFFLSSTCKSAGEKERDQLFTHNLWKYVAVPVTLKTQKSENVVARSALCSQESGSFFLHDEFVFFSWWEYR